MSEETKTTLYEGELINIILKVPKNTAAMTVSAIVMEGKTTQNMSMDMGVEDIRVARQDFLDNCEEGDDYDAVYVLTDEGRAFLDELDKEKSAP